MFSNKNLLIVFSALLTITALVFIIDSKKKEDTFKHELFTVDSVKVSKIVLYPKIQNHKPVELVKDSDGWKVEISSGKFKPVPPAKIKNLITQIVSIKPTRLAATSKSMWKEFQVDTSGTRIEIFEGGIKTLDMVIGKFSFQQPQSMHTYVRLTNDKNVYSTDGFLEFSFNRKADSFRNEKLVDGDSNIWDILTFTYPGDSSFQLIKKEGKWYAEGQPADSLKTARYLSGLSHLSSSGFDNDGAFNLTAAPIKLKIDGNKNEIAELTAVKDSSRFVIHSAQNYYEFFDGYKDNLGKTVFKTIKDFLPGKK